MFLTSNNKAEIDFNANFWVCFTIDGDQEIFDGLGHYNHFYSCARHAQIVSINYGTYPNQLS